VFTSEANPTQKRHNYEQAILDLSIPRQKYKQEDTMKSILIILALVLSLLPLSAVYHKIGEFDTPGTANDVEIVGNIAYVADGAAGLVILDISDPQNPILLGSFDTPGNAVSVAVNDSVACVIDGDLQIIDVSNPQYPVLLSYYNAWGDLYFVELSGNIAYVQDHHTLYLIDISNPQNPALLGSSGGSSETAYWVKSIAVVDSILYWVGRYMDWFGNDIATFLIINISDPQNPTLMGSYTPYYGGFASGALADSLAYLSINGSLIVVDVSNPQNATLLTAFDTLFGTIISIVDNNLYILNEGYDFKVVDISNPLNPVVTGYYALRGEESSFAISGNRAYITDGDLQIIDIQNPQNSSLCGGYDTEGEAKSLFATDNDAYIADGESGLVIIDTTNPYNPVYLGSYDTPGEATAVKISNNKAYVADGSSGLQIIDLTNPSNPSLLGSFAALGNSFDVLVDGGYGVAFLANTYSGINIINVVNPQNPSLLHQIGTPLSAFSFTLEGCLLYVADELELRIYNVIDFAYPYLLGSIETLGNPLQISVANNTAYLAEGGSGLQIIDVSNPASPASIGTILPHSSSSIRGCYTHDNLLFVSDAYWNEISVYNITNPQAPVLNNHYAWNLGTYDMCVAGSLLYTANGLGGLNILNLATIDNDDEVQYPVTAFQMKNYPNPFYPETSISYTLPAKGQVCLEIYNSKGQLVRSLVNEQQAKGEHSLTWNGKDNDGHSVASGLYLCRITSAGQHESRKLMLLK
jgi:hypothetical protein